MKASKNTPETMLTVLLKLSIFYLLCIAILNAPRAKGQTINFRSSKQSTSAMQQKVQQIYTSQIGVREKGSNAGVAVEQYLRYVNLSKGNPWCAAFVCWVFGRAGVMNPRTGWTPLLFSDSRVIWGRDQGTKIKEQRLPPNLPYASPTSLTTNNQKRTTPSPGDIFGLYFPEKKRIAHVGFIDQWDGTWMVTVEGNTNVAGGREGDGVYRKRRLVRTVYRVARYVE